MQIFLTWNGSFCAHYLISSITGTPALTSRSLKNTDFEYVIELLDEACSIALEAKAKSGKKLVEFKATLENDADIKNKIVGLKSKVNEFSLKFPMPGFDDH